MAIGDDLTVAASGDISHGSGVAISYKLMGMEFKAAQIEAYFNFGLKQK